MKRYNLFIDKIIENAPDFLTIEEDNEIYLSFDYFVNNLSDKAMPWLFKVYLDKKFNIIVEDKISKYAEEKYSKYSLKIKDLNGNIFLNKDLMVIILNELNEVNQLEYNDIEITFSLK
ncbi:MAG: hypothetical protein ACRDDE_06565 [Paraclostridium sp.]|uniref:hypothetical protein n=1 Tax=Paraclostridium sp. TaxID=2023273 RepID=UPI003EE70DB4